MPTFLVLGKIILYSLGFLNVTGYALSGIWLGFLGEWWTIFYGILSIIIFQFLFLLSSIPGGILILPIGYFGDRGLILPAIPFMFLSTLYSAFLVSAWSLTVFWFFNLRIHSDVILPTIIWSYGVAIFPWIHKTLQDEGVGSFVSVVFSQIAYVTISIMFFFFDTETKELQQIFVGIMGISVLVIFGLAIAMIREHVKSKNVFD
jgi:hypothetical protein